MILDWTIWRDHQKWPFEPPEYVFFVDAAVKVLQVDFPDVNWSATMGHQDMWGVAPVTHPSIAFDAAGKLRDISRKNQHHVSRILQKQGLKLGKQLTKEAWSLAHSIWEFDHRFGDVARESRNSGLDWLQKLLAHGAFYVSVRDPNDLGMKFLDPATWAGDRDEFRRVLSVCRARVSGIHGESWLFVKRSHLDDVIEAREIANGRTKSNASDEAESALDAKQGPAQLRKSTSGRRKPKWFPHLEKHWIDERDRRRKLREEGKSVPIWPTDAEFLAAVQRDARTRDIKIRQIAYHRRETLDPDYGRE